MDVKCNGISVYTLPDGAKCNFGEEKQNPLFMDECPMGGANHVMETAFIILKIRT